MSDKPRLSVIIITHNEAKNIRACLQSIQWADEIVIVDAGSDDDTINICREFTEKVFIHADWPGFGAQKNRALDYATGDWVFSIDADERVTDSLREEILSLISTSIPLANAVYRVPRQSFFMGKAMRHGGWWPDNVVRLFRREQGRFSDDLIHEKILYEGKAELLENALNHYSFTSIEQVLRKTNHYSSAGAQQAFDRNRQSSLTKALTHGAWTFFRAYILRAGFLDGVEGFVAAVSNAEGTYYRYLKLMYLHRDQT